MAGQVKFLRSENARLNDMVTHATTRAEAVEALVAELQSHQDVWMDRAFAAEAEAFKLGSRLAEWIDRAHNAEAEVARLVAAEEQRRVDDEKARRGAA